MNRFPYWLYERLGGRLYLAGLALGAINAAIATCVFAPAFGSYLEVSLGQLLHLAVIALGLSAVALVLTRALSGARVRPVLAWMNDSEGADAPTVWLAAVRLVPALVALGVAVFSVLFVPWAFYSRAYADLPWTLVPVLLVGVELTILLGAILDYFGFQRMMVPLIEDVAAHLPDDFVPGYRAPPLRHRLFAVVIMITIVSGVVVGSAQSLVEDPVARLAVGIGTATVVTLTVGLLPLRYLSQSVVEPVAELEAAVEMVEAGDLQVQVPVVAADEISGLTGSFNRMTRGLREREALHSAIGAYIDPAIAERVVSEGSVMAAEHALVTIMFIDIVGFTSLAEDAIPEEVVSDLNDFFGLVIPTIEEGGGHPNKLLGDGLMAVFGAPRPLPDHADRALAAACKIQIALAERYEGELRAGIGLNSGVVVVGTMGGGRKLDYTIIGDPVNVAARVEAHTRETGDSILITESTKALLSPNGTALEGRGQHVMKGRSQPVEVYAVTSNAA